MYKEITISKWNSKFHSVDDFHYYEITTFNYDDHQQLKKIFEILEVEYFENSHKLTFLVSEDEIIDHMINENKIDLQKLYADNWRLADKKQAANMLNFFMNEE